MCAMIPILRKEVKQVIVIKVVKPGRPEWSSACYPDFGGYLIEIGALDSNLREVSALVLPYVSVATMT